MTEKVTEKDLARFAALGYPAPVEPASDVAPRAVAESLCRAVESPSARLLDAALLALDWLAEHDALEALTRPDLSPEASRRLGFLAEKLAETHTTVTKRRLKTLANSLYEQLAQQPDSALTFAAVTTDAYLQQLREKGDHTNERWQVFVELDSLPSSTEVS